MTKENKEELLRLYKLLWEQIKYEIELVPIGRHTRDMMLNGIISNCEEKVLDKHMADNMVMTVGLCERKSFVQRMITELDNEITKANNN